MKKKYLFGVLAFYPILAIFITIIFGENISLVLASQEHYFLLKWWPYFPTVTVLFILLVFIIAVFSNSVITTGQRLIWFFAILILNIYALPLYWWFYIYKTPNKALHPTAYSGG